MKFDIPYLNFSLRGKNFFGVWEEDTYFVSGWVDKCMHPRSCFGVEHERATAELAVVYFC